MKKIDFLQRTNIQYNLTEIYPLRSVKIVNSPREYDKIGIVNPFSLYYSQDRYSTKIDYGFLDVEYSFLIGFTL